MARYKHYDYDQTKMLPVSYERQILPGTFEHTLNELIDQQIDLTVFESRYRNDATGAPAYDPAILLKIVLFAYSKGITSSREIEKLCRENVLFMALSADTQPHFTTIADFISGSAEQIAQVFRDVLLVCDEAGLIGKQMFAIDGVKLPSNASKEPRRSTRGSVPPRSCSHGIGKSMLSTPRVRRPRCKRRANNRSRHWKPRSPKVSFKDMPGWRWSMRSIRSWSTPKPLVRGKSMDC